MSLLGGIGRALGGFVKQVAPSVINAIAPAASKLLKGIVGDTFKAGGALLKKLAGNLPGPLAGLAQKLLGKALPKLQAMAQGGVEKLIAKLADSITKRFAAGVGNIAVPGLSARTGAIAANTPGAASAPAPTAAAPQGAPNPANYDMSSVSGQAKFQRDMMTFQNNAMAQAQVKAATTAGAKNVPNPNNYDMNSIQGQAQFQADMARAMAGVTSASTGAATGTPSTSGASGTGATNASGPSGAGSSDKAPNPENYDMESIKGQAAYNKDMLKFQQALQNMQNYFKSLSDVLAGQKDTMNKLSGNLR